MAIIEQLTREFELNINQSKQAVSLLDDGNTVPFIARYRKEATGNLDDQLLRAFDARLKALRNLESRKADVIRLIDEQGKLDPQLKTAVEKAETLTEIEDLYRPFKPKRRTRASMARDKGLQPLADLLLEQRADSRQIMELTNQLVNPDQGVEDSDAALAGAMDILAEYVSDQAWVRRRLRRLMEQTGMVETRGKTKEQTVFEAYYDYREPVARIAHHRVLAINRGEKEEILSVKLVCDAAQAHDLIGSWLIKGQSASTAYLQRVVEDSWKRLLEPSISNEIRQQLTDDASKQAMDVFAANLRSLLLQPPISGQIVLGLDPGFRTGCKLAVVDATGRVLDTGVIYPTPPYSKTREAGQAIMKLVDKHGITLVAIGNGTASRESVIFITDLIKAQNLPIRYLVVSEAGASVYSASELAAKEFPDFDVSLRSAVSIARRVQDPLAELVKIEPRSIGVGQYQHDMPAKQLEERLAGVVEDCVNQVGVDLNTASVQLLSYVAGISASVAANIVRRREKSGAFKSRSQLLDIPRLGDATYLQCAGFLRIPGAANLLDDTAVHPESYPRVEKLSSLLDLPAGPKLAQKAAGYPSGKMAEDLGLGEQTYLDILDALARPGRDPRDDMPQPSLRQDVIAIEDLKPGMTLPGVVRNVADFGAFVDIGVHQDGLVHISELADRFVKRPMDVVSTGQAVMVKVLSVDVGRKRISLSMKGIDQTHPGVLP